MGAEAVAKRFVVYQSKKRLILPTEGEISRLYCLSSGYSNEKRVNQGRT